MVRNIVYDGWCHYTGSSGVGNDALRMLKEMMIIVVVKLTVFLNAHRLV